MRREGEFGQRGGRCVGPLLFIEIPEIMSAVDLTDKREGVDDPPRLGGRYVERGNSDNAAVDARHLCYS